MAATSLSGLFMVARLTKKTQCLWIGRASQPREEAQSCFAYARSTYKVSRRFGSAEQEDT